MGSRRIMHTEKRQKNSRDLDLWPMTLKFNRVLEVVEARSYKLSSSWLQRFVSYCANREIKKKTPTKTIQSVATARTVIMNTNHRWHVTTIVTVCGGDFTVIITWWLGSVTAWTLDLRSQGHGFDSRSGCYQVVSTWMGLDVCGQVNHYYYYCLSNAMLCICIGQNIKSRKRPSIRPSVRPSVRPASVDKNVA